MKLCPRSSYSFVYQGQKQNKFKNNLQPFEKLQLMISDEEAGSWQNFKRTFTKCI